MTIRQPALRAGDGCERLAPMASPNGRHRRAPRVAHREGARGLPTRRRGGARAIVFLAGPEASGRTALLREFSQTLSSARRSPQVLSGAIVEGRYVPEEPGPARTGDVVAAVGATLSLAGAALPVLGLIGQAMSREARPVERGPAREARLGEPRTAREARELASPHRILRSSQARDHSPGWTSPGIPAPPAGDRRPARPERSSGAVGPRLRSLTPRRERAGGQGIPIRAGPPGLSSSPARSVDIGATRSPPKRHPSCWTFWAGSGRRQSDGRPGASKRRP